jgi:hypothetical protein
MDLVTRVPSHKNDDSWLENPRTKWMLFSFAGKIIDKNGGDHRSQPRLIAGG